MDPEGGQRDKIKAKEDEILQLLQRAQSKSQSKFLKRLQSEITQLIELQHEYSDSVTAELQDIVAEGYYDQLDKETESSVTRRLIEAYQRKTKVNLHAKSEFAVIDPAYDQKLLEKIALFDNKVDEFLKKCATQYIAELSRVRSGDDVVLGSPLEIEAIAKILDCRIMLIIDTNETNAFVPRSMELSFGDKNSTFAIDLRLSAYGTVNAKYLLIAVDGRPFNVDLEENRNADDHGRETKSLFYACLEAKKIHESNLLNLNNPLQTLQSIIAKVQNKKVYTTELLKQEVINVLTKDKRSEIAKWFERLILSDLPALQIFDAAAERTIILEAIRLQRERANLMAETRIMTNIVMSQLQDQLNTWKSSSRATVEASKRASTSLAISSSNTENYTALTNSLNKMSAYISAYCQTISTTLVSNRKEFLTALAFQSFAAFGDIASEFWSESDDLSTAILTGTSRGAAFMQTLFTIYAAAFEEKEHHSEIVRMHERFVESIPIATLNFVMFTLNSGREKGIDFDKELLKDSELIKRQQILKYWRYSSKAEFYLNRKDLQTGTKLSFILHRQSRDYANGWIITNNSRYFLLLLLAIIQSLFTVLSLTQYKSTDASKALTITNVGLAVIYEFILLYATIGGVSRTIDSEILNATKILTSAYNRMQDLPSELLAILQHFGVSDETMFTISKLPRADDIHANLSNLTHELVQQLAENALDSEPHIQRQLQKILQPFLQLLNLLENKELLKSALNGSNNGMKKLLESVPKLMHELNKTLLNLNLYEVSSDKDKHRVKVIHDFGHAAGAIFDEIRKQDSKSIVDAEFKAKIRDIPLDGNCLFNAVFCGVKASKMEQQAPLIHVIKNGDELRGQVVQYMVDNIARDQELLDLIHTEVSPDPEGDVDEYYSIYIENMSKDGVWGGAPELYILQKILGVQFMIFEVNNDGDRTARLPYDIGGHQMDPTQITQNNTVRLTYNGSHYQVILDHELYDKFLYWQQAKDERKLT